ncbi:MAG: HAMP domain-containing protein [Candidatus Magnetomorum sp.]|nr:HAMP domain-containing protein [Candidatus Magnetomorum sp.]
MNHQKNNKRPDNRYSKKKNNLPKKSKSPYIVIIVSFLLLTYCQIQIMKFDADIPVSNTVLMFILMNINMLLMLFLIYLVFRNAAKLIYERRIKKIGSKLRTKMVLAFLGVSLIPTIVLFFFSVNFISTSIEFWFNASIEQAFNNALAVGRGLYDNFENHNQFYTQKIANQIQRRKLYESSKKLKSYIQTARRTFNLFAVEVYSIHYKRIAISMASEMDEDFFEPVSVDDLQKKLTPFGIRHLKIGTIEGEFIKTIGAVPFNREKEDTKVIIVISTMIGKNLSQNLALISKGIEEYQQLKLLKHPVKLTHYVTLTIVVLMILFGAIWFALKVSTSLTVPIQKLAEGTRRIAGGDLSFRIGEVGDDEMGSLVESFNKMTNDLQRSRKELEYSTIKLRDQNTEIEEKRQYMEIVLDNISAGVISLDAKGLVSTINKSAAAMLSIYPESVLNHSYRHLLHGQHLSLASEVMDKLTLDRSLNLPLKLHLDGRPKSFMLHATALRKSDQHMGMVLVFDDLTEQEKLQRIAAWREVARRIAHEVKNPLTPIKLSAQRLQRKFSVPINDSVFDECIKTIIDQVDQIRNLVNEFSAFARFPTVNPVPCDLVPIIEETISLYREGTPHICFTLESKNDIPKLNIDKQQFKRAFINFFDNALSAIGQAGEISVTLQHLFDEKGVRIEVADSGIGISEEDKPRLFEPYFSTKEQGTGLGLSIVNSIISDHNGKISVMDNEPQGTKFIIEIPV